MTDEQLSEAFARVEAAQKRIEQIATEGRELAREVKGTLDTRVAEGAKERDDLSAAIVRELGAIRRHMDSQDRTKALGRAAMAPTTNPPPAGRGPLDTHDSLAATSTDTADSVLDGVDNLSWWKSSPALVVGFVGSVIALAVSFGVPITKEQTGAILAVAAAGLGIAAHYRGRRTRKAIVRAMTSSSSVAREAV